MISKDFLFSPKVRYYLYFIIAIVLYLSMYIYFGKKYDPNLTDITIRIRAIGSLSFVIFSFILCIGPLSRLTKHGVKLIPSRRHFGVTLFFIVCSHAYFVIQAYHQRGEINPILNIFIGNTNYQDLLHFPFETLGVIALCILFVMALLSNEFSVHKLTGVVWRSIHFSIYVAYVLIIFHILLGPLRFENEPVFFVFIYLSFFVVIILQLSVSTKEFRFDIRRFAIDKHGYITVGAFIYFPEGSIKIIRGKKERIAVYKDNGHIYALSNACKHLGGPLGEGKVKDGCVTCPWHGYQYMLNTGQAPAPYKDKVDTYHVKISNGIIYVKSTPEEKE